MQQRDSRSLQICSQGPWGKEEGDGRGEAPKEKTTQVRENPLRKLGQLGAPRNHDQNGVSFYFESQSCAIRLFITSCPYNYWPLLLRMSVSISKSRKLRPHKKKQSMLDMVGEALLLPAVNFMLTNENAGGGGLCLSNLTKHQWWIILRRMREFTCTIM